MWILFLIVIDTVLRIVMGQLLVGWFLVVARNPFSAERRRFTVRDAAVWS